MPGLSQRIPRAAGFDRYRDFMSKCRVRRSIRVVVLFSLKITEISARRSTKKARLMVLLALAASTSVMADEEFVSSVIECRSVLSVEQRLQCYDSIVDDRLGSGNTTATSRTAVPAATATAAATVAEESFGLPPLGKDDDRLDRIEATIVKLSKTASGKVSVGLDNGQTWRQTTSSSLRLSEGDEVVIRRRTLGAYSMSKPDTSRSMRVKRVE